MDTEKIRKDFQGHQNFYSNNILSLTKIPFDGDDEFSKFLYIADVTLEMKELLADDLSICNHIEASAEDIKYVAFDLNVYTDGRPAYANAYVRLHNTELDFTRINYPHAHLHQNDNYRALGAAVVSDKLKKVTSKGYISKKDVPEENYSVNDFFRINLFAKLTENDTGEAPDKETLLKIMRVVKPAVSEINIKNGKPLEGAKNSIKKNTAKTDIDR